MKIHDLSWLKQIAFIPKLNYNYAEAYSEIHRIGGDATRIRFPLSALLLNHPEAIKHVLVTNAKNYRKADIFKFYNPIFGQGLVTSEGEVWKRSRRLIGPTLHHENLIKFDSIMVSKTEKMMSQWSEGLREKVDRDIVAVTLSVLGEVIWGEGHDLESEIISSTIIMAMAYSTFLAVSPVKWPAWVKTPGRREYEKGIHTLNEVCASLITKARKGEMNPACLLSKMVTLFDQELGIEAANVQLTSELKTLILAGHETTAQVLSWALYLLANNPDAQAKVHAEVSTILNGRAATHSDIKKLTYTNWVIAETLRLYPSAPSFGRHALNDDNIMGMHIPKGQEIFMTPCVMHRHPDYWDQPDVFMPERFATPPTDLRYFPFGAGPRGCPGQTFAELEAPLILATLLQKFKFEFKENTPIETKPAGTLQLRRPLNLFLTKREKTKGIGQPISYQQRENSHAELI